MIFKQGSFEQELFEGMQAAEIHSNNQEIQHDDNLVLEALQELNAAAESFESIGLTARASEVTRLIGEIADSREI
jgi:hypothetical protein